MARSAIFDPIEKFRFKVSIFDLDISLISSQRNTKFATLQKDLSSFFSPFAPISYNQFESEIKAGFTEVTIPRSRISELVYRENIDPIRSTKSTGLVTYEPIVFRRGVVIGDRGLYNWYKKVNNDINTLSPINNLLGANNIVPIQQIDFRKDIVIEVLNRAGITIRAWLIFNAFPVEYKGGNDLVSNIEEKLIEEIIITYEAFVELPTADINQAIDESEIEAREAFASAAVALAAGGWTGFF